MSKSKSKKWTALVILVLALLLGTCGSVKRMAPLEAQEETMVYLPYVASPGNGLAKSSVTVLATATLEPTIPASTPEPNDPVPEPTSIPSPPPDDTTPEPPTPPDDTEPDPPATPEPPSTPEPKPTKKPHPVHPTHPEHPDVPKGPPSNRPHPKTPPTNPPGHNK